MRTPPQQRHHAVEKTAHRAEPSGSGEDKKQRRWWSARNKARLLAITCLVASPAVVIVGVGLAGGVRSIPLLRWATASTSTEQGTQVEDTCDMTMGKWVKEPKGPVYTYLNCPLLPDHANCLKYGKDPGYLYWRWQPDGCDLPRFSPAKFLALVRGKRLAFIGDSLARNHMESLLCLLSQAETPTDLHAGAGDARNNDRKWHFPGHDFTLMSVWTEFFVHAVPVVDGEWYGSFNVHLDRVSPRWTRRLPELDYAVVSGGNWFFRANYLWERGRRVGCVHCRDPGLAHFGIAYAVRRAVRAAVEAVAGCRRCKPGLVVFLRTYTPDHFEHGSWFSGGRCNRTRPLEEGEVSSEAIAWALRKAQVEEVRRVARETTATIGGGRTRFGVLDVTKATMMRADGHPGEHFKRRLPKKYNDCLHLCLPGPIDMWNDVLLRRLADVETSPRPAVK